MAQTMLEAKQFIKGGDDSIAVCRGRWIRVRSLEAVPHAPVMTSAIPRVFIEEPPPVTCCFQWPVNPLAVVQVIVVVMKTSTPESQAF
jgi:hypothetical protein